MAALSLHQTQGRGFTLTSYKAMKKYQVKDTLKGDLMLGDTKYKPGQTIVDNGNNRMLTRAIANCLKMTTAPIKEVEETKAVAPPSPKGGK